MKIMCLNGWGGKLQDSLTSYLTSASPDVLCLKEVVHTPETDKDWLTYRDNDHVLPRERTSSATLLQPFPILHDTGEDRSNGFVTT
jgi:hypothetical protein